LIMPLMMVKIEYFAMVRPRPHLHLLIAQVTMTRSLPKTTPSQSTNLRAATAQWAVRLIPMPRSVAS